MRVSRVLITSAVAASLLFAGFWLWYRALPRGMLHRLAESGDVEGLRKALRGGADPNAEEQDRHKMIGGWTPIMYAAEMGHLDCVRELIDAGANVNAEDTFERPVLAYAVESPEIVALLLERGADATRCARSVQYSAVATAYRLRQAQSLKLILDAGVAPSSECLRYALFEYTLGSAPRPIDDVALAMLIRRAEGDLRGNGAALLLEAADSAAVESCRLLLELGISPNEASPTGVTPLMAAVGSGSIEVVALLLERGADPARHDNAGKTAHGYVAEAESRGLSSERAEALRRMLAVGDGGG